MLGGKRFFRGFPLLVALTFASFAPACLRFDCHSTDLACNPAAFLLYSAGACNLGRDQIIQPVNSAAVLQELQLQAAAGVSGDGSAYDFASGQAGAVKWAGGVLAPNGMIYGIPATNDNVLVIDPNTNTATIFASGHTGPDKWAGGVLAPNGLIYGFPNTNDNVLVIDPNPNTATTFASDQTGLKKWFGGVVAPNGLIYAIPENND